MPYELRHPLPSLHEVYDLGPFRVESPYEIVTTGETIKFRVNANILLGISPLCIPEDDCKFVLKYYPDNISQRGEFNGRNITGTTAFTEERNGEEMIVGYICELGSNYNSFLPYSDGLVKIAHG